MCRTSRRKSKFYLNTVEVETEQYFLHGGQPYFMEGETIFYSDDDHLSVAGALRVVPAIEEILTRLK